MIMANPCKSTVLHAGMNIPLQIDNIAFGGAGVGRYENRAVFVPFTAPGDELAVTITEVKNRYARGLIKEILAASPLRIPPRCPYFTRCGGCDYQHLSYPEQLAVKEGQIRETFRRIGGFPDPPVAAMIPSPQPFHYRGKGEFFRRRNRQGSATVGFLRAGSHELIEIERCEIVHESINAALAELRSSGGRGGGRPGLQKLPVWSQEQSASLPYDPGAVAEHLETAPGKIMSPGHCPPEYCRRQVRGKTLLVPQDGFFQANLYLVASLVEVVTGMCALTGRETVVDAYGGSGLFSLFLAPLARQAVGIEGQEAAVQCARLNLAREGIGNADFLAGDVGDVLREMFVRTGRPVAVLLLDPPRTGCERAVLEAAAELRPARIVYVSCHPATLARDCRFLAAAGYRLRCLQPLDMFPQTAHIETVCLLQTE